MLDLQKKIKRQIEIVAAAIRKSTDSSSLDLAVRYHCEELTIKRDLRDLRSVGIDIHSRKNIGIRLGRKLEQPQIVSLVTQYLAICNADQSVDRATRLLVRQQKEEALGNIVILQRAIERTRIVTIDYVKESDVVEQDRDLQPLMIFQSDGYWRVLAVHAGIVKQYLVNKMMNLRQTDRAFRRIPQDEIETMFLYSFRSWIGSDRHTVRIRLSPLWANRIKPRQLMESQVITEEPDGSVIFETTVNSLSEIAGWVVSRGEGITVLDPPALRDLVIETARAALRNYQRE